jgi:hypothetical protein
VSSNPYQLPGLLQSKIGSEEKLLPWSDAFGLSKTAIANSKASLQRML